MAEPIINASADPSGWRTADVPIESVGYAAYLILGLGDEIEVVEPSELREEVVRLALATAALYAR
jgi:predicted DNA-binding transcriptional regulator YafY